MNLAGASAEVLVDIVVGLEVVLVGEFPSIQAIPSSLRKLILTS